MNRSHRSGAGSGCLGTMEEKSKFGAEFCRFSLGRSKPGKFEAFYGFLQHVHKIATADVVVGYADIHGEFLLINADDNYHKAVSIPLLGIFIQKKGSSRALSRENEDSDEDDITIEDSGVPRQIPKAVPNAQSLASLPQIELSFEAGQSGFTPNEVSLAPVASGTNTQCETRAPHQKPLEEDATIITLRNHCLNVF